jgi:hypothetical protein
VQDNLLKGMPVKAQVTASFPAYWFFELTATNELKGKLLLGGSLSYGSTGGRVSYSDFSGSLWSDQLVSNYTITTLFGTKTSWFNGKLSLQGDVRPGITVTTMDYSYNQDAGTSSYYSRSKYHSLNLIIQPTATLSYRWRSLSVNSFVGYNINFVKGDLRSYDNFSSFGYYYPGNSSTHADWSGLRAGGGLALAINESTSTVAERFSVGMGLGLNYGGIGVNFTTYPQRNVGVFLGVGYALAGMGANAGLKLRLPSEGKKWYPYFTGMYGYNAAVKVSGNGNLNQLFYGSTFGVGLEQNSENQKDILWSFALLVPVRGPEVDNYINALKATGVQFTNTLLPIAISAGFRFNNTR